ncbi:hypothetical protein B296_00042312 [Ensete ventricosum]|uniref:Uncharacterized protein n=1 Tax=Ensete ventricosum TaxID=4639 RepID=A0A426X148_ENSVE|nr:hypothetical protein B296_00042312 [Ensete ventricosum]
MPPHATIWPMDPVDKLCRCRRSPHLGIGSSSDDAVGSHWKFTRRFAEGIGKLVGNAKGDRREEDRRTCRKIVGGCWSMWECRWVNHPVGGWTARTIDYGQRPAADGR